MFFNSVSWNFDVHNVQNNFPSRTILLAMLLYERISLFQHTWIQNWLCTTFYGVLDDCHIYRKTAERDNTVITFFILCFPLKKLCEQGLIFNMVLSRIDNIPPQFSLRVFFFYCMFDYVCGKVNWVRGFWTLNEFIVGYKFLN